MLLALAALAACAAQTASRARIPTSGSFGAELAARDDAYLDLYDVRPRKPQPALEPNCTVPSRCKFFARSVECACS